MSKKLTVIDYGMGNLWSVLNALRYLGCDPIVSSDPGVIVRAEALLLPGVGSFRKAMIELNNKGLDDAILESVLHKGRKILGICLGMQLLGISSTEDGDTLGLGLINTCVDKFTTEEIASNKVPHIGFDTVFTNHNGVLFENLSDMADFYFVHSYRMMPARLNANIATCNYGIDFLAAYEKDNVFATQFHPEKSQTNGLHLLNNFLSA